MSRRPTVRGLAAAAILPLALGTLSACGEDEAEPTKAAGAESSADAGDAEPAADGADRTAGESVPKDEFMDLYRASVEDLTTAEVVMDMTGSGMEISAEGVVDYSSEPAAMELSYTGDGQNMDMVMLDNVMYMSSPEFGEKWVKFDVGEAAEGMGLDLNAQMDMRQMLDTFEAGLTDVEYVGEEQVDGDDTDQYRLTVDTEALTGEIDLSELGAAGAQLPKTMTFDIFFDDDEQFRRMAMDIDKSTSMTMDFDNWGTDVDIEAPPADQTTTLEELLGSMGGTPSAGTGRS